MPLNLTDELLITRGDEAHYNRFIDLNDFTADQRLWKNLWLRFRFRSTGGCIKRLMKPKRLFNHPLNLEPIYWKRQFAAHGEDLAH